jgi:hypothetical protein
MAGGVDPLVLAPGSSFGAWFNKVQEIAKRSWKSALIIATVGIAAPRALVTLITTVGDWTTTVSVTGLGALSFRHLLVSLFITLILSIAAAYVASAGWAAGVWALVQEAATGRPANVADAFKYGLKRAMSLFPWAIAAGAAVTIGSFCLLLPGLYLAFGFSLFGFVALFERGVSPIGRSFSLTHNSATIGPTLGKVGILFGVYLAYTLVVGLIFGAIGAGLGLALSGGFRNAFGFNLGLGLMQTIGTLLSGPALAVLLIGLLPTYAELRSRESSLSTPQLRQELGD